MYSTLLYFSRNVVYGKEKIENWIFWMIGDLFYSDDALLKIRITWYNIWFYGKHLGYLEWKINQKNVKF